MVIETELVLPGRFSRGGPGVCGSSSDTIGAEALATALDCRSERFRLVLLSGFREYYA